MRRSKMLGPYAVSQAVATAVLVASSTLGSVIPIAQEPAPQFVHLGLDDGLSQSSVSSIVQDHHGLLWFGTQDGLNRWDGHELTVFRPRSGNANSLGATTITSLAVGADGTVWIGSFDGGLWAHHPANQRFEQIDLVNGDRPVSVRALAAASDGTIAVGTAARGLWIVRPDRTIHHCAPRSRTVAPIQALTFDRQDLLWFGLRNQLYTMNLEGMNATAGPALPPNPSTEAPSRITSLQLDTSGRLWVGAIGGVWSLDTASGQLEAVASLQLRAVRALEVDRAGRLWVGTRAAGLALLQPRTQTVIDLHHDAADPTSLATNFVTAVFEDRFGVVWVGVEGFGVSAYDPARPPFEHIRPGPNGLGGRIVRAIEAGVDGDLWVGTAGGGLDRIRPDGRIRRYRHDPGDAGSLSSDAVWTLLSDRFGKLWIGTRGGGLNLLDPQTERFHRFRSGLSSPVVLALLETAAGSILVGTAAGLDIYSHETEAFRPVPIAPDAPVVRSLAEGPPGTVWIGTSGGLFRLDEDTERWVAVEPGIDEPGLLAPSLALHWSSNHALWIGTQKGVVRYQPATADWRQLDRRHGLPNDVIYSILEDDAGHLWLSSNKGLTRLRPPEGGSTIPIEVRNFDRNDGLQGNEFNTGAALACAGTFFFGGINGLTAFRPEQIPPAVDPPPVALLAGNLHSANGSTRIPLFGKDQVTLAPETKTVSLEFTALGFSAPESHLYRYRLQGFDDQWISTREHRFATYTNLDPTQYTFQVQAGIDGRWTDPPAQLTLIVQPPWWQSYWAIGVYGLMLVVGGVATDRIQRRRLLARERERSRLREAQLRAAAAEAQARIIESENRRKSDELEEARDLQLSMLPHELPRVPGLDIAARMVTATEVGGDYYDLHAEDRRLSIAIGDATGHGLAAGTVVSVVKGVFSAATFSDPPSRFLSRCNGILRRMRLRRLHMAMSVVHIRGPEVTFATAGMPPLLIRRAYSGSIEEAFTAGLPLGSLEHATYSELTLKLHEGDLLVAVSDGLPETLSPDGEPFGYARLKDTLSSCSDQEPEAVAESLLAAGTEWRGSTVQHDDVTVLVVRTTAVSEITPA